MRAAEAEQLLHAHPEVTDVYSIVGPNGDVNKARLRVSPPPKERAHRGVQALKEDARARLASMAPPTRVVIRTRRIVEGRRRPLPRSWCASPGRTSRRCAESRAPRADAARHPGHRRRARELQPARARAGRSRSTAARANDLGVSAAALALQLRLAMGGDVAAKLREGKDETDIRVRLSERDRATPERVRQIRDRHARGPACR